MTRFLEANRMRLLPDVSHASSRACFSLINHSLKRVPSNHTKLPLLNGLGICVTRFQRSSTPLDRSFSHSLGDPSNSIAAKGYMKTNGVPGFFVLTKKSYAILQNVGGSGQAGRPCRCTSASACSNCAYHGNRRQGPPHPVEPESSCRRASTIDRQHIHRIASASMKNDTYHIRRDTGQRHQPSQ